MSVSLQEPLSSQLRKATAVQHRRLESSFNILDPGLTLARYIEALRAFRDFLQPWEAAIETSLSDSGGAGLGERRHAWRAQRDLACLGAPTVRNEYCAALPCVASRAQALGSMYVIEGSTLGGQLISRAMNDRFGLTPECGCHYFAGYGEANGRMWADFKKLLDAIVGEVDREAATRAAVDTFDCLERWLVLRGVAAAPVARAATRHHEQGVARHG